MFKARKGASPSLSIPPPPAFGLSPAAELKAVSSRRGTSAGVGGTISSGPLRPGKRVSIRFSPLSRRLRGPAAPESASGGCSNPDPNLPCFRLRGNVMLSARARLIGEAHSRFSGDVERQGKGVKVSRSPAPTRVPAVAASVSLQGNRVCFMAAAWGLGAFGDPPGRGTPCVCVYACPCAAPPGRSRSPRTKPSPPPESSSPQSVNNFQRGVTLSGKAFSTLSAGNWTII